MRGLLACMAALGFAVLQPAPVSARETAIKTGNDLLDMCASGASAWSGGACYGFILGVYRGLSVYGEATNHPLICLSEDVTVGQTQLIVQAYLHAHPKEMSGAAEWGVASALLDAFPCPKTK